MSYRFRKKETLADGFRRILNEQTAAIVSALADGAEDPGNRIHDARKRLKRQRALLKLVASLMDEDVVAREEHVFQAVSRKLGAARDADVALETFEGLAWELVGPVDQVRALLTTGVQRQRKRGLSADKLGLLAGTIRKSSHILTEEKLLEGGLETVFPAMLKDYEKARKLRGVKTDDPVKLHDLRKLAKRLMYQLTLLRKMIPNSLAKLLPKYSRFTELLGNHQDLQVLKDILAEHAHGIQIARLPMLDAAIHASMKTRIKKARRLSREIFDTRPKGFAKLLRSNLKSWDS